MDDNKLVLTEPEKIETPHDFHMKRAASNSQHARIKKLKAVGTFSQKHPRDAQGRFRPK